MGPVESKSYVADSSNSLKPRKSNSLGDAWSIEPEITKKLLVDGTKCILQTPNTSSKSANATPAKTNNEFLEPRNH